MPTDEKDEEQPACIIPSAGRAMYASIKYLIGHPRPLNLQIPTTDSPYLGGQIRLRLDHLDYVG